MNRDEFPACPRCTSALDRHGERWVCTGCKGILIADAEVSQLVADMVGSTLSFFGWSGKVAEPKPLDLKARTGDAITCPRCPAAMATHTLYGLDVDRCEAHGIWFDGEELERALQTAAAAQRTGLNRGEKVFMAIVGPAFLAAELLALILGRR